ncbi:hypothetical protein ANN_15563 [Periplaneta americana]|uniref:Uncharacterized protein n=1 Tax=Periplaneta americana TaxID=6978 RepID=A0ABQ8SGP3_PERAM|nr:hypothetical protein ANN_15563 [Periplaneta americana]
MEPVPLSIVMHLGSYDRYRKFGEEYNAQFSILELSPFSCNFIPLSPKYFPKHLILKHPYPMFLSQSESPSFTTIKNNRNAERNGLETVDSTVITHFRYRHLFKNQNIRYYEFGTRY